MTASPPDNETIFHTARAIPDADRRRAYVREACGGDETRVAHVEALLAAADAPDSLLDCPAGSSPATTIDLPAAEAPGTAIGPYKLIEQIGEGGMGSVWLAQQTQPVKRLVAIKLIKAGMDSKQVIARFEAERQALALMDHPNIARVLDAGTVGARNSERGPRSEDPNPSAVPSSEFRAPRWAGRPYFVMDLVKGVPITRYCDERKLTPRERLELFLPVCQAIQHAHQKGIIHRDIKPSNVLVALYDDRPVPKVIDFGVAKATGQSLTEKTLVTGLAIIGTLEYMSPEQAEINQLDIDTRSDVYSLGVLLYELLTGTTPLARMRANKSGILEALRIIREEEIPTLSNRLSATEEMASIAANRGTDPGKLTKLVRGELDWIVMKALEKDRNRRYETASGLGTDVQRYLAGAAVQAVPPSAGYRLRKFVQRNRREVLIAGVATVAAAGGVAGLAVSRALIARALKSETEAKERERVETYFQRITVAHRELSIDNLAAALRALRECPDDLRDWEWHYLIRLCKVDPLVIPIGAEAFGVAFSSDGKLLASAGGDGRVKIWNSQTGEVIRQIPAHAKSVVCVTFHVDGRRVAAVDVDNQVKVWDWTTGREEFRGRCDVGRKFGTAQTAAFSPDGRRLAAGSDGGVRVWDWEDGRVLHTLPGHERNAVSVAFSRDGRQLASASTGDNVRLWSLEGGEQLLRTFPPHTHPVGALAFSPDGGRLAEANFNRCVNLWDTRTGELRRTLVHTGNALVVAFSPDGRRLVSSGEDKTVRLWDANSDREIEILGLRGHKGMCGCVAFSPDGLRLASCSTDGTIRIWDATPLRGNEGQELFTFPHHDDEIRSVVISPDGQTIGSAGIGALVKTWDAATGEPGVEFNAGAMVVFCLAWQPGSQRIASVAWDGRLHTVRVWDVRDKREAFALPPGPETYAVAFSPDGRYLITGNGSGVVEVWDARDGKPVGTLGTHTREIRGLVFSPRSGHVASASGDGEVKLWDATRLDKLHLDGKPEPRIPPIRARVPGPSLNVAFSPDGRWLVTGGEDNTVKIWVVKTGELLRILPEHTGPGHTGDVYAVAFSPDGRWVASGGEDSTVKVWDARNEYRLARNFRGHTGLVASLAFSPNSQRLVSGSRDRTVKVWDVSKLGAEPNRN
jgi:WD40 repeat protein/serine/threonine protein kinase